MSNIIVWACTSTKVPLIKYTPDSTCAADPIEVALELTRVAKAVPAVIVVFPYTIFSEHIRDSPSRKIVLVLLSLSALRYYTYIVKSLTSPPSCNTILSIVPVTPELWPSITLLRKLSI